MLDELLGRAALKAEIKSLTEERDRLAEQLEAESERRRAAVRDKQDVESERNQLADRIAGLEGELERLKGDETELQFDAVYDLSRADSAALISLLTSVETGSERALTAVIDDEVPDAVEQCLGDRTPLVYDRRPCVVCADDLGVVRVVLTPPVQPDPIVCWGSEFHLDRSWFLPPDGSTFALVRSDRFAIADVTDGALGEPTAFTSEVMGRHSKGGFSQARFERRRSEQVDSHLDRVRDALEAHDIDELVLVGDKRILTRLEVDTVARSPVDASGPPAEAISDAFESFWRTQVYLP